MAVSPNPRTLLIPDPDAIPSVLGNKIAPIFFTSLGFLSGILTRSMQRRPLFSGIQHHLLGGLIGAAVGKFGQDRFEQYCMDRDASLRHYIELHPEDFPMPERKKVGELFPKYIPIR